MIKEINKICFTQELSRPYYVRRKNNSPVLPFSTLTAKPTEAQATDELTWNGELLASSTTRSILTLARQTQSLFQFSKLVFNEIMGNEQILDSFHQAEIALKKRNHDNYTDVLSSSLRRAPWPTDSSPKIY